jgi:lon-related putative ATP-dependent protease
MMADSTTELTFDQLRRVCDLDQFTFDNTGDLPELDAVVGQDRAVRAISFGIDIESPGYHMYALGPAGTGKTTTIQKFLKRKSREQPVPDDWLYVNNFENPDQPIALSLPAGMGCKLEEDIDLLVEDLGTEIPSVFEGEDYDQEREKIQSQFQKRRQALFSELEEEANSQQFTLVQTPRGISIAPLRKGEVITPEQYSKLDESTRKEIERRQEHLKEKMRETVRKVQDLQQEAKEEVRELDKQVVGYAVEHLIDKLKEKYADFQGVLDFLESVRADILKNVDAFKQASQMEQAQQQVPFLALQQQNRPDFNKYRVNLIVNNCDTKGAPVIMESNPTHANLLGRVEHQAQFGALITDFRMIKAGALHNANGGYLMVSARDILTKPLAWDGLKRALQNHEIKIESLYQAMGAISTRTLDPEPIPLDIKVVVTGDPILYYLLYNLDEDFKELFKVKADFAVQMDWEDNSLKQYAQFIGTICQEEGLSHFSRSGVAKVVEHSAREVSHQGKLATKFGDIVDLIREASYWSAKNGNNLVEGQDVAQAIDERIYRANKLEERIQEMIEEGTILIDTKGEIPGQVNGISIMPLGDYAFGKPSRITARTYVGKSGVINIERETELGGRIHNKGVMILAGFMGGKFAQDVPLAFSASITFEQLYSDVEGDSASSAELYALLSSLSGYPIRQNLAVTGSVNQRGQVQAIGGVNQKIEGFFDVCKQDGLTGAQGVIIPQSNVKNLMLREDVVQAVKDGEFHIYPVERIDQGIELLTGVPVEQRDEQGEYPEGSFYYAVMQRLEELAEKVRSYDQNGSSSKKRTRSSSPPDDDQDEKL